MNWNTVLSIGLGSLFSILGIISASLLDLLSIKKKAKVGRLSAFYENQLNAFEEFSKTAHVIFVDICYLTEGLHDMDFDHKKRILTLENNINELSRINNKYHFYYPITTQKLMENCINSAFLFKNIAWNCIDEKEFNPKLLGMSEEIENKLDKLFLMFTKYYKI